MIKPGTPVVVQCCDPDVDRMEDQTADNQDHLALGMSPNEAARQEFAPPTGRATLGQAVTVPSSAAGTLAST